MIPLKGTCRRILTKTVKFSCYLILISLLSLSPFWLPVPFSTGACNRLVRGEEKARSLHFLTSSLDLHFSILPCLNSPTDQHRPILPLFCSLSARRLPLPSALQSCCCCMSSDSLAVLFHLISELPRSFGSTCKLKVDNPIPGKEYFWEILGL